MPEHEDLDTCFTIGSMTHPHAMMGMPDCSGVLSYEFWVTEKEYIIVVRLKLDEFTNGESEPAADILSLVKKDEIPEIIEQNEENYPMICQEMMLCHLESLFEFYENLKYHTSFVKLFFTFLFSQELGLYSRIARKDRDGIPLTDQSMPDIELLK